MPTKTLSIAIAIGLAALLVLGACAVWYSYARHVKIAHNEECGHILSQLASSTTYGVNILPSCVYEIVPPSIWELLVGGPALQPSSAGCDQSETTTDCALLAQQNPPPAISQQKVATTSKTIGNFSIEYPLDWYVTGFGWEQASVPGAYNISIPDSGSGGEQHVYIFTLPSPLGSINSRAKTLDDYRTDYPLSATSTRQILVNGTSTTIETHQEVRILSSEDVTINGIPMLRQHYSVGEWSLDASGNRIFDTSNEADVTDELRYVFFDGKTFVVITGWHADAWIDQIARSVQLQ
jgi:hypothetical protein